MSEMDEIHILRALVDLRKTRKQVLEMLDRGALEGVERGGEWYITRASLDRALGRQSAEREQELALLHAAKAQKARGTPRGKSDRYLLEYEAAVHELAARLKEIGMAEADLARARRALDDLLEEKRAAHRVLTMAQVVGEGDETAT